ncbi:MAG: CoA ester lyase [Candidatus Tectimicrobiota bacterium]
MQPFVRRSHLLVSARDEAQVEASWTHQADAVVLDLADSVPAAEKPAARERIRAALPVAARGGAEVFVRINKALAYADIAASVWPGLHGIVLTGAETAADVDEVATLLATLEKERGLALGTLVLILLLDSGKGVWNIRQLVTASPRVCSVGLDEPRLCDHLGIVPTPTFDPFVYAKGRVIIESRAAKRQPVGLTHPAGLFPQVAEAEERYRLALQSKNTGFAGILCLDPAWVEPSNRALTPSAERLEFYRETRRLFAEGIARGTAAIPYPGTTMMIDVPVDERARITLELWERCAARDAEKAAALQRAHA